MQRRAKIVDDACVPYGAGMSTDRQTIYIDSRIPRYLKLAGAEGRKLDVHHYIEIHETTEAALMHLLGIKYQDAHRMAQAAEHEALRQDGFDPAKYEAGLKASLASAEHDWANVPDDLDREPYRDSKDWKLLAKMGS